MENVCSECGHKFLGDLRFCPDCGGKAVPPKSTVWDYREHDLLTHEDPVTQDASEAYKVNGWVLLCNAILLVPAWLFVLDEILMEIDSGEVFGMTVLGFLWGSVVMAVVLAGVASGFQARRPGVQILAAALVVFTLASVAWLKLLLMGLGFCIVWGLGARKTGEFLRPHPWYMVVMSGLGIVAIIVAILWFFGATMC